MTTTSAVLSAVNWKRHRNNLAEKLVPQYINLMEIAWADSQETLSVLGAFNLSNPHVRGALKELGGRITGISETTRDDIKGVLDRALGGDTTLSTDKIARMIRESGATNSVSRSEMIARTESAVGLNHGAIASYQEAGVDKVEVLDGDGDEECAAADGQIWTLDEARANPIAHPNCVRAFAPVVDN